MYKSKIRVRIGRGYRDAFRSICELVKNGCIDSSLIETCRDDRWIETPQYIFEYTGDDTAIDTGSQAGMTAEGATWFEGFRGGENDSVMGIWHDLIEAVATGYHKEYSLVEYVQSAMLRDAEEAARCRGIVTNVVKELKLPFSRIVDATTEDSEEDIYGVSLRMELFSGAGEPRPVLCRVYFRKVGHNFLPIEAQEAEMVDRYVGELVEKQRDGGCVQAESNETEIVDNVLNAVSKLIGGAMSRSFTESVLITNSTDVDTVHEMVRHEPQDSVALQCKQLKVLGISHVRWIDAAFNVYVGEKKAFLAKMGLNNAVNLFCCCGSKDNKLIENNEIVCFSKGSGGTTTVRIKPEEENLGLSESELDTVRWESAFAHHFAPITCSEISRRRLGLDCLQYRCDCNTLEFEYRGSVLRKCADCPYPEVVYRYGDGTAAYTPLLSYDSQSMSVVSEETAICRFCGRSYQKTGTGGDSLCAFCQSVFDLTDPANPDKPGEEAVQTYRRYASMLPISLRILSVFKKKYCFENADRLIFAVGRSKYFFDKLRLTDSGRIVNPEKRQ